MKMLRGNTSRTVGGMSKRRNNSYNKSCLFSISTLEQIAVRKWRYHFHIRILAKETGGWLLRNIVIFTLFVSPILEKG